LPEVVVGLEVVIPVLLGIKRMVLEVRVAIGKVQEQFRLF
jgi:hypothetical protein